ncbi:MAG: DUF86 domain-containing protein [Clostridiales bacterium]|nr:DUF86 domain-containing protein [Clostridiales bacterium]
MAKDIELLKTISSDIEFILKVTENMTLEQFEEDELTASAVCFKFVQISENASKISQEFMIGHNNIPWQKIKGMRNRIVHDYGNVSLSIVYATIQNDLPKILELIK